MCLATFYAGEWENRKLVFFTIILAYALTVLFLIKMLKKFFDKSEKALLLVIILGGTALLIAFLVDIPAYVSKTNIVEVPINIEYTGRTGNNAQVTDYNGNKYWSIGLKQDNVRGYRPGDIVRITYLPTTKLLLSLELKTILLPRELGVGEHYIQLDEYREVFNGHAQMWPYVVLIALCNLIAFSVIAFKHTKNIGHQTANDGLDDKIAQRICKGCRRKIDIDYPKCPHCGYKYY